jgi:Xaa-Pro aminopeptidase
LYIRRGIEGKVFKIPESEYRNRIERLVSMMQKKGVDAIYLSSGTSFMYFTGFSYLSTERPAAMLFDSEGSQQLTRNVY